MMRSPDSSQQRNCMDNFDRKLLNRIHAYFIANGIKHEPECPKIRFRGEECDMLNCGVEELMYDIQAWVTQVNHDASK